MTEHGGGGDDIGLIRLQQGESSTHGGMGWRSKRRTSLGSSGRTKKMKRTTKGKKGCMEGWGGGATGEHHWVVKVTQKGKEHTWRGGVEEQQENITGVGVEVIMGKQGHKVR